MHRIQCSKKYIFYERLLITKIYLVIVYLTNWWPNITRRIINGLWFSFATCEIDNRSTLCPEAEIDITTFFLSSIKHFRCRSFYRRRIFRTHHNCSINRIANRRELFYRLPSFYSSFENLHSSRGNGDAFCRNKIKEQQGKREREKEFLDTSWRTIAMNFCCQNGS